MDWGILIGPILNMVLAQCLKKTAPSTDVKTYLRARYNATTKTFDEPLVKSTMKQVRKAINHAKRQVSKAERKTCPNYQPSEIRQMAIDKLTAAMKAPDAVVAGVMAAAATFAEIDGDA